MINGIHIGIQHRVVVWIQSQIIKSHSSSSELKLKIIKMDVTIRGCAYNWLNFKRDTKMYQLLISFS